jgi:hypothetical protein
MKITKILVALLFSFAVTTANAGELTVTGNMETTYHTQSENTTGNPLGMDRELKFAGTTELDNGMTVSVMQDTSDNLGYGNSQIAFGNVMGLATIYVGSDSDPVDAIDDITPSAYEEANGSGSGTYNDIGDAAGNMGIGAKFDVPVLGAVNVKYYPRLDATKNADNASSGNQSGSVGTASSISIKTDMGNLPGAGGYLDGLTLTTGLSERDHSTILNADDAYDMTAALNYSYGQFKFGYQKKLHNEGEAAAVTDAVWYKDDIIGVAYAYNDALSISYNRITSYKHNNTAAPDQETDAFNIGYTMGGMTIGFQDASTDNANHVLNSNDDTRTLGVSIAF